MKILWVKSGALLPLDTGGKIRSFNIARELGTRQDVSIFTFYPEQEHAAQQDLVKTFPKTHLVPMRLPERASLRDCIDYGRNLFSLQPHPMTKYCRPEVARKLRQLLTEEKFDAVLCDFLLTAAVIPWDLGIPTVVFTHNVEAVIWKRRLEVSTNPIWKMVNWREYKTMSRVEALYLKRASHVLAVSEDDKKSFAEFLSPDRITVVPTGVDIDFFRPQGATSENALVFTGSMDWLPNEDGIQWFAENIFPRVQAAIPDCKVYVVGRQPSQKLQRLAAENKSIAVTGRVEDVRPYIAKAGVYIVPLRIGGGTRIKIFEAMAMARPVVSTTIGAEGLPVSDGKHLLLADSPDAFASSVITLLKDKSRAQSIGQAAREEVEHLYSWSSVSRKFDEVLETVVATQPKLVSVH